MCAFKSLGGFLSFLAFTIACIVVKATADSDLHLTSASRSLDGSGIQIMATYRLDFEATEEPEVIWYRGARTARDTEIESHTQFSGGSGHTEVTVPDDGTRSLVVNLFIGNLDSHFLELRWASPNSFPVGWTDNVTVELDYRMVSVNSGTDLSYTTGQDVTGVITVSNNNFGPNAAIVGNINFGSHGKWIDPVTEEMSPDMYSHSIPFLTMDKSSDNATGTTLATFTFKTSEVKVKGVFDASLQAVTYPCDYIPCDFIWIPAHDLLYSITDHTLFSVHEAGSPAPDPSHFLTT